MASRAGPIQSPMQSTAEEIRQGIDRLAKRLEEVRAFEPTSVVEQDNIPHVLALAAAVDDSLIRTFGPDTLDYRRYSDAGYLITDLFQLCVRGSDLTGSRVTKQK
jgi:hypothetical protein